MFPVERKTARCWNAIQTSLQAYAVKQRQKSKGEEVKESGSHQHGTKLLCRLIDKGIFSEG